LVRERVRILVPTPRTPNGLKGRIDGDKAQTA
jgi:hypothetical protein